MSTTISYGSESFTPVTVDGWAQESESRTIVHELISGDIEVTHAPGGPRTFTMQLVFPVEADAAGCAELHRTAPYLDLVTDERVLPNGRYVVTGRVGVELDDETRDVWVVTVDATEVPT